MGPQFDIDSLIMSEDNAPVLFAQNSAIWSRLLPVVPSFLPDTPALSVQDRPAVSETEKVQLAATWSRVSDVKTMMMSLGCDVWKATEQDWVSLEHSAIAEPSICG